MIKNKLVNNRILIIGDSILDTYVFIEDAGKSLETETFKAKYQKETTEFGGASRVIKFLSKFDVSVDFITNMEITYFQNHSKEFSNINLYDVGTMKTAEKIRFKLNKNNKFETILQINKQYIPEKKVSPNIKNIINADLDLYDIVLIDDYRTGMFNKQFISIVNKINCKKLILASQLSRNKLNISNYKNFHILVINDYEFEKEFNTKLNFEKNYRNLFSNKLELIIITLGSKGAILLSRDGNKYFPTKPKKFINTIGAGDIFLSSYLLFENINLANEYALEYLEEINSEL